MNLFRYLLSLRILEQLGSAFGIGFAPWLWAASLVPRAGGYVYSHVQLQMSEFFFGKPLLFIIVIGFWLAVGCLLAARWLRAVRGWRWLPLAGYRWLVLVGWLSLGGCAQVWQIALNFPRRLTLATCVASLRAIGCGLLWHALPRLIDRLICLRVKGLCCFAPLFLSPPRQIGMCGKAATDPPCPDHSK